MNQMKRSTNLKNEKAKAVRDIVEAFDDVMKHEAGKKKLRTAKKIISALRS
jgi:hypothetical protein